MYRGRVHMTSWQLNEVLRTWKYLSATFLVPLLVFSITQRLASIDQFPLMAVLSTAVTNEFSRTLMASSVLSGSSSARVGCLTCWVCQSSSPVPYSIPSPMAGSLDLQQWPCYWKTKRSSIVRTDLTSSSWGSTILPVCPPNVVRWSLQQSHTGKE